MLSHEFEDLDVEPPQAEGPFPGVAVGALEIGARSLAVQRDVPAATPLVRHQRAFVRIGNLAYELGVLGDGAKPVGDGKRGALERGESGGEICREDGEDDV